MPESTINQSQQRPSRSVRAPGSRVDRIDYRNPNKFPAAFLKELSDLHGPFASSLADKLGRELRTSLTIELMSTEQLAYDAYVRSMPNPSLLEILELRPLPGRVVYEMSSQLGLVIVDRMLGGPGKPVTPRPPTALEQTLLGSLVHHPMLALKSALANAIDVDPHRVYSELNPQLAHIASPTETVVVLTFSVIGDAAVTSLRGLVTLCYPASTLDEFREAVARAKAEAQPQAGPATGAISAPVSEASVELALRTESTPIAAADLARVRPGDVVVLDHRVDAPLIGLIERIPFMKAHLGRQEGKLAARVESWNVD